MKRLGLVIVAAVALLGVGSAGFLAARHWDVQENPAIVPAPRPLRSVMLGLAQDMERINYGLWVEEYEMIREGARGVADHPKITADERSAIQEALQSRFQAFVAFDEQVHAAAIEMAAAAETRDMARILDLYRQVQRGCLTCHATFRDEVRKALAP